MKPSSGTLVYDGRCGFCCSAANWIAGRWPSDSPSTIVPSQELSAELRRIVPFTQEELDRSVWWFDQYGREEGARAVGRALLTARGLWKAVGVALLTPPVSWLAPIIYRLIVRSRRLLPGTPRRRDANHS